MADVIELDPVETLGAGAVGVPGQRAFYIQARKADVQLTVLVEKEQVAMLATEALQFLERLAGEFPEDPGEHGASLAFEAALQEPTVPLFRARLIGLGYDPARRLVLLELRERTPEDEEAAEAEVDEDSPLLPDDEGFVARLYASRAQLRAMAAHGVEAVASGRPKCSLCDFPMDPDGHICPRWN
jgi:uncharacterized repeat protein (TIGR03847 family)